MLQPMRVLSMCATIAIAGCGGGNVARDDAGAVALEDAGALDDGVGGNGGDDGSMTSDAAMMTLPDCACFAGDGIYCGAGVVSYGAAQGCSAPGLAQHAGDLYRCSGGAWTIATGCGTAGCYVAPTGQADGCHVAGATKKIFVVFAPNAIVRDLAGLFQCLLARTDFNDRARGYTNGYGLSWGGSTSASCAASDWTCAVAALAKAKLAVGDHDVVELVEPGYCGGDNNAKGDGAVVGNIRVRGANVGDCPAAPAVEERVAVHEAFESVGHWANADCCTGEVAAAACADNGEAFCPDCPCACGKFQSDGSYGGYTLDCGGGKTYFSQRVPTSAKAEFDPNACSPFTVVK